MAWIVLSLFSLRDSPVIPPRIYYRFALLIKSFPIQLTQLCYIHSVWYVVLKLIFVVKYYKEETQEHVRFICMKHLRNLHFVLKSSTWINAQIVPRVMSGDSLLFVLFWFVIRYSGEISPTRCNNCVFYSQWLYFTCFGWQSHPSSGVQCCIWPQVSWLT